MKLKRAQRMQLGKVIVQASREEGQEGRQEEGGGGSCRRVQLLPQFELF